MHMHTNLTTLARAHTQACKGMHTQKHTIHT
jgi:hypothetical protein